MLSGWWDGSTSESEIIVMGVVNLRGGNDVDSGTKRVLEGCAS